MRAKLLRTNLLGVLIYSLSGACSSSADQRPSTEGGGGGSHSNGSAGSGVVIPPPVTGSGGEGTIIIPPTGEEPESCQKAEVVFEPKIPTVFVLVDRSGSMFREEPKPWEPLKAAVLETVSDLQTEIRFGFGAFTGEIGQMCPMFDSVNADFNNLDKIKTLYDSLKEPVKGETPTMTVLAKVRETLTADTTDGPKYILFVTDGEPDYCADGNAICPVDAVVYQLQELYKVGIQTFVFGLQTSNMGVPPATLQAWANAGAGQPVGMLTRNNQTVTPTQIYNECSPGGDENARGWKTDFTALGRPALEALGTYADAGGTATVFKPDAGNQAALAAQIRGVVNNVKSCTFDLQGQIEVKLDKAGDGKVRIDGNVVPFDATNGWRMLTPTQLQLEGSACQTWRDTGTKIDFDFPCEIIVVVK